MRWRASPTPRAARTREHAGPTRRSRLLQSADRHERHCTGHDTWSPTRASPSTKDDWRRRSWAPRQTSRCRSGASQCRGGERPRTPRRRCCWSARDGGARWALSATRRGAATDRGGADGGGDARGSACALPAVGRQRHAFGRTPRRRANTVAVTCALARAAGRWHRGGTTANSHHRWRRRRRPRFVPLRGGNTVPRGGLPHVFRLP